jgi:hypothetical protein
MASLYGIMQVDATNSQPERAATASSSRFWFSVVCKGMGVLKIGRTLGIGTSLVQRVIIDSPFEVGVGL